MALSFGLGPLVAGAVTQNAGVLNCSGLDMEQNLNV